jgi:hypothetical protein
MGMRSIASTKTYKKSSLAAFAPDGAVGQETIKVVTRRAGHRLRQAKATSMTGSRIGLEGSDFK